MRVKYSDIDWQKCQKEKIKLQRKIIVACNNKDLQQVTSEIRSRRNNQTFI